MTPVFKAIDTAYFATDGDDLTCVEAFDDSDTNSIITTLARGAVDNTCVDTNADVFVNDMAVDTFFHVGESDRGETSVAKEGIHLFKGDVAIGSHGMVLCRRERITL